MRTQSGARRPEELDEDPILEDERLLNDEEKPLLD